MAAPAERESQDEPTLTGSLLVASPQLTDPNFSRTVVLVLEHGEDGALGVVLNRPTALGVDELLEPWARQAQMAPPPVMFRGGPVAPDAVIGLARVHRTDETHGRHRVLESVTTVDLAVPPDDQPPGLEGVRLFSGYAGWSAEQLEEEIAEGAWFTLTAVVSDLFASDPERLWHDVLQRQGGDLAMLSGYPPHPSLN